jgi:transcriptional regulator with XRE-family HTH domain
MPEKGPLRLLRQVREAADLSQTDMALYFGFNGSNGRNTVARWENGEGNPPAMKHRRTFISYLAVKLGLHNDRQRFDEVWNTLQERWGWLTVTEREWVEYGGIAAPTSTESLPTYRFDEVFLSISKEVFEYANRVTIENQETLIPFLENPTQRASVGGKLYRLYENQKHRGNFARWMSYFTTITDREDNYLPKKAIGEMLTSIQDLERIVYSSNNSYNEITKYATIQAFNHDTEDHKEEGLRTLVLSYLSQLRNIEKRIGETIGLIEAMR